MKTAKTETHESPLSELTNFVRSMPAKSAGIRRIERVLLPEQREITNVLQGLQDTAGRQSPCRDAIYAA